jgi:hypothetical protein
MEYKNLLFKGLIVFSIYSCSGPEGKIGPAGKSSLVNIADEPPGKNCANGGTKIETGIDTDGNNQLSNNEVTITKYVCKSDNGKNSLINVKSEPSGINCSKGGLKIETGLDNNGNGILDSNEISQTKFICNGDNGISSLTTITSEPSGINCKAGGFKIQIGLDVNGNLILDQNEIQSTKYLCTPESSGQNDKLVRLEIGESNVGTNSTEWYLIEYKTFHLIKFNKLDYSNVDSITFVPSMYTISDLNKVYVELYNLTDNVSINNTQLESNVNDWIFKESKNIYKDLPNKETILGIRLKSENENYVVSTGIRSYLFIYKH